MKPEDQPQTPVVPLAPSVAGPSSLPGAAAVVKRDSGKTLGIIALALSFVPVVGIVLGIMAQSKSKKAGSKNLTATIATILSIVFTLAILGVGGFMIFFATGKTKFVTPCYSFELPKEYVSVELPKVFVGLNSNNSCSLKIESKSTKNSDMQRIEVAAQYLPGQNGGSISDSELKKNIDMVTSFAPSKLKFTETNLDGAKAYMSTEVSEYTAYSRQLMLVSPKVYSVSTSAAGKVNLYAIFSKSNSKNTEDLLKVLMANWKWAK